MAAAENSRAGTRWLVRIGNVLDGQMGIGIATGNCPLLRNQQPGVARFQIQQVSH